MKKSLIALAVAGAFAAPAFAASSNVDIYGVMSFSLDWADTNNTAGADASDLATAVDNVSRIGFKGAEDLGGGMKALWQVESELHADLAGGAGFAGRNTFVGLGGGFGTVVLGKHDTPYKLATGALDPFADTVADYNNIIGSTGYTTTAGAGVAATAARNMFDVRAPQTIAYISPTFSGFHVAAAYVGAKVAEAAGNEETDAWSLMGMYQNGPLTASLAYETHSGSIGLGAVQGVGAAADEIDAWKLGVGYSFGDAKVNFVYEDIDGGDINGAAAYGEPNSRTAWYLSGTYAMGPIVLKAAYGAADDSDAAANANDGADFWAIGADYNLSKRTSIYAVYANVENDTAVVAAPGAGATGNTGYSLGGGNGYAAAAGAKEASAFSVGIKHTF